jgi:hypothetical protein
VTAYTNQTIKVQAAAVILVDIVNQQGGRLGRSRPVCIWRQRIARAMLSVAAGQTRTAPAVARSIPAIHFPVKPHAIALNTRRNIKQACPARDCVTEQVRPKG